MLYYCWFCLKSKYRNLKTTVDNITFHSKKEAKRYLELKMLLKSKQIYDLELQPKFEICPTHKWNGKTQRKKQYIADFSYTDKQGNKIVEDVKGMRTQVYILKRSLFLTLYPQYIFKEI